MKGLGAEKHQSRAISLGRVSRGCPHCRSPSGGLSSSGRTEEGTLVPCECRPHAPQALPPQRGGGPLHSPCSPSTVVQKMEAAPASAWPGSHV